MTSDIISSLLILYTQIHPRDDQIKLCNTNNCYYEHNLNRHNEEEPTVQLQKIKQ